MTGLISKDHILHSRTKYYYYFNVAVRRMKISKTIIMIIKNQFFQKD